MLAGLCANEQTLPPTEGRLTHSQSFTVSALSESAAQSVSHTVSQLSRAYLSLTHSLTHSLTDSSFVRSQSLTLSEAVNGKTGATSLFIDLILGCVAGTTPLLTLPITALQSASACSHFDTPTAFSDTQLTPPQCVVQTTSTRTQLTDTVGRRNTARKKMRRHSRAMVSTFSITRYSAA